MAFPASIACLGLLSKRQDGTAAFESLAIQAVLPTLTIFLKLLLYLTFILNLQLQEW